jgi:hypothetical protein
MCIFQIYTCGHEGFQKPELVQTWQSWHIPHKLKATKEKKNYTNNKSLTRK